MKNSDLAIAKQMFRKYNGNHYMMEREDEYETYKAFGISEKLERSWRIELRNEYRLAFERATDAITLVDHFNAYGEIISALGDKKALRYMLAYLKKHAKQLDTVTAYNLVSAVGSSAYGFDQVAYFRFALKRKRAPRWKWTLMTEVYHLREGYYSMLSGAEYWTAMNHTAERKMARALLPVLEQLWERPFRADDVWKSSNLSQFCTEKIIRENICRDINAYKELLTTNLQRMFAEY